MAAQAVGVEDPVVQLDKIFFKYFKKRYRPSLPASEVKRGFIDLSGLIIEHQKTQYTDKLEAGEADEADEAGEAGEADEAREAGRRTFPSSKIAFETEFSNTTGSPQSLTLHTEREISTTYKVTMQHCFTKEGSLSLSISLPSQVGKAGIGAKASLQLTGGTESTEVEKVQWSLNTSVPVPCNTATRVAVLLDEKEVDGEFSVVSRISGTAVFRPRDSKGRWSRQQMPIVVPDVRPVLLQGQHGFSQCPSGRAACVFTSEGRVRCSCVMNQRVRITEEAISQ